MFEQENFVTYRMIVYAHLDFDGYKREIGVVDSAKAVVAMQLTRIQVQIEMVIGKA